MSTPLRLLAVLVPLAGCGHSLEYTATNTPPRPMKPRDPASVEVFVMKKPDRPHVEVGLFEIEQRTPASGSTPAMITKLRERAAEIGCDALLVGEAQDRVQSYTAHSQGTVHVTSGQPNAGYGTYQGMTTGHPNVVRKHFAACVTYTDVVAPGALTGSSDVSL